VLTSVADCDVEPRRLGMLLFKPPFPLGTIPLHPTDGTLPDKENLPDPMVYAS